LCAESGMTGKRSALLVVDVQKDFCPGGALAVPGGDRVVPALNRHIADLTAQGSPVYASRDWHPPVTAHFKAYGGQWPPHCVQDTGGASFHEDLRLPASAIIISKGQDPERSGYSAFEGFTPDGRTFLSELYSRGIDHLFDALRLGFEVTVLGDAIAGVDVHAGDSERAIHAMRVAGAKLLS
jgi:nicotinamidase/pyrazinamidase